ncbi:fused MFS/spermidine synthase [bacterium]|nr:fused MFS/spermidine synthase [bacterium]
MAIGETKKLLLGLGIFASGFVGLGYQIIWTKQLVAAIGLETPAILAIVTAFMGGFSIGAFTLDRFIRQSNYPLRWLAGLELLIGSWGAFSFYIAPQFFQIIDSTTNPLLDPQESVLSFFSACVLFFLPSTVAMGATLPAMERAWRQLFDSKGCVGLVYGINTAGAAFGVLIVTFSIIPTVGLQRSLMTMCCVSVVIGFGLLFCRKKIELQPPLNQTTGFKPRRFSPEFVRLGILGLLGMSYQLLCVRVLSQSLENTVFTYASILSIYLLGTSIGGIIFHRIEKLNLKPNFQSPVIISSSGLVLLSLLIMPMIPSLYNNLWEWANMVPAKMFISEIVIASSILLLPTIGTGFLFAALIRKSLRDTSTIGIPLGYNLVGATAAPLIFSGLIPILGTKTLLLGVGLGFLILVNLKSWHRLWPALPAVLGLVLLTPSKSALLGINENQVHGRLTTEGIAGVVSVAAETNGHKRLEVNNRFMMGSTHAAIAERRQAHLPLLIHPSPKQALFLGVGTGITLGAAAVYPELRTDGVELLPEIIDYLGEFSSWNRYPYNNASIRLHRMDARRFVKQTDIRYDVIVADVFHPARDGAGLLYTREHFEQIKTRLSDSGIFCQWLPLHQFDQMGLSSLRATFQLVFSNTSFWLLNATLGVPVIAFIGSIEPIEVRSDRMKELEAQTLLFEELKESQLHTVNRIMTCFLQEAENPRFNDRSIPINTDDFQFVSYHAPLRQRQSEQFELLTGFLSTWSRSPQQDEPSKPISSWQSPWIPYLNARDLYLKGQLKEVEGDLVTAIEYYLEGIKISPKFTLGYARCVSIAMGLNATDTKKAISLLKQLEALRPTQSLANRLLDRIQTTQ